MTEKEIRKLWKAFWKYPLHGWITGLTAFSTFFATLFSVQGTANPDVDAKWHILEFHAQYILAPIWGLVILNLLIIGTRKIPAARFEHKKRKELERKKAIENLEYELGLK